MPRHSADIHDQILQYTLVAADALQDVAAATQTPFLKSVCSLSAAIIPLIQNTKFQKARCLRMTEAIHQVLCGLLALCTHSTTVSSPQMLEQIARYAETLQKLYTCLRAQTELGKIRRIFKQREITAQLDVCERELNAASNIFIERITIIVCFKTEYGVGVASALIEMHLDTESRHQELLELISSGSLTTASSIWGSSVNDSSGTLSLLPPSPKIFHGRDSELNDLIGTLLTESARVVVLGPGGMGKTTVAMAALHHQSIIEKYNLRHFISCESATTSAELISIIGSHLGLERSTRLKNAIVRHFEQSGLCLVVLDNLETPWEPLESRGEVEELLSLLTEVSTLALLITMRGAERPAKVKWTRPFLPPLEPLSPSASRQIFSSVADEPEIGEQSALDELVALSDNLPLAVSLMASVASYEGYTTTLSRWKIENTALVSDGGDKRSNLEISIMLSLRSPRISSDAKSFLSLLSILPDGITDQEIIGSKVPLPHIAHCRTSLVRTSLAYVDRDGRLKALSPIREFIRKVYPPSMSLSKPLRTHFQDLLMVWWSHQQLPSGDLVPRLVAHIGNFNELILQGLADDEAAWPDIARNIINLDSFSQTMLKGSNQLLQRLPGLIEVTGDSRLRWKYVSAHLTSNFPHLDITHAERWIADGLQYFQTVHSEIYEAVQFYTAAAYYYHNSRSNPSRAREFTELASRIGQNAVNPSIQALIIHLKFEIMHLTDGQKIIKLVHEARQSAAFGSAKMALLCSNYEAYAHMLLGYLPRALDLYARSNELVMALGMQASDQHLFSLDIQADIHWRKTEYSHAHTNQTIIGSMTSPSRSPWFHANALATLAYLDIAMSSDEVEIVRNLDNAKGIYKALDSPRIVLCSFITAHLFLHRGESDRARVTFEGCLIKSRDIYSDVKALCLAALGDPRHKMHNQEDTFRWASVFFSFGLKSKDRVATFHALRCLADIYDISNDEETALSLYHTALEGATEMDIHRLRAESMTGIGDIMMRRGDMTQAKEMWEVVHPLFLRSSQMKDAAAIDARVAKLSENLQNDLSGSVADHTLSKAQSLLDWTTLPKTHVPWQNWTD
ncbi:hypothetical protein B0H17DRAFT_1146285 [Mycena rosella]|uniref:NB-ARC domain-containing protein n=1 Tax=Mycena rosella TaxID=1033263 RepID=A0AAD7CP88_MYCRO|nr:hypothetical protein B0H17DRAFT_1146285 [Mycena rosella]